MDRREARWLTQPPDDRPFVDDEIVTIRISGRFEIGPLWDGGTHISNHPDELAEWTGMSSDLAERIIRWHDRYQESAAPDDRAARAGWERQRATLRAELTAELRAEVGERLRVLDELD